MAHAVVRTDNLASTDVRGGEDLVSVRYQPSNTKTAIDNGNVVLLGDLETGEREVYKGATPAANSPLEDVVLITTPEVMYDERLRSLDEYFNEAGKICRGSHFHRNDTFSVTKDALDGKSEPAVNDIVELKAGTKMNVAASLTSGSTQVGHIIAIEQAGRFKFYVIKVD